MSGFAVVQIKPLGYKYSQTFDPVARLLNESLRSLGLESDIVSGRLLKDKTNIIVGYNLLPGEAIAALASYDCVIYQLEQLAEGQGWYNSNIERALRTVSRIWDYSHENLAFLLRHEITGGLYVPLGFHPSLRVIEPADDQDIDVLFYGSRNPRRSRIITQLEEKCRTKWLFGVYGRELDAYIARAKIVLNIHFYETAMEKVRISYLLNNACFVVSEESGDNPYAGGLVTAEYEDLAETCLDYLDKPHERKQIAEEGYELLREMPMERELERVLRGRS